MINYEDSPAPECRCRCTPEEIEAGHRHRSPAGPPNYVTIGDWAGLTPEEIEARLCNGEGSANA